jgi:hypothetical protein
MTIIFRSGKATIGNGFGGDDTLECWTAGDEIILREPGRSEHEMPIDINTDGTLQVPILRGVHEEGELKARKPGCPLPLRSQSQPAVPSSACHPRNVPRASFSPIDQDHLLGNGSQRRRGNAPHPPGKVHVRRIVADPEIAEPVERKRVGVSGREGEAR